MKSLNEDSNFDERRFQLRSTDINRTKKLETMRENTVKINRNICASYDYREFFVQLTEQSQTSA